jgi:hypothetical protein
MKKSLYFSVIVIILSISISACGPKEFQYSGIRERVYTIDSLCEYTSVTTAEDLKIREKIAELDSVCEYLY